MSDPLVLYGEFRRASWGIPDWIQVSRDSRSFMCYEGVETWFRVPRAITKLRVVISPYRDPDAYPISLFGIRTEDGKYEVTLVRAMRSWIRRHTIQYPQFNFYFAIEVQNAKRKKGSRSWVRAARLLHAAGSRPQPSGRSGVRG